MPWTSPGRRCYDCFFWRLKHSVFTKVEVGVANISRARMGSQAQNIWEPLVWLFHSQLKGSGFDVGSLPLIALVWDAKPWPTVDIYSQLCSVCSFGYKCPLNDYMVVWVIQSSTFRDRSSVFVWFWHLLQRWVNCWIAKLYLSPRHGGFQLILLILFQGLASVSSSVALWPFV